MIIKIVIYLLLTVSGLMLFKLGGNENIIAITASKFNVSLSTISIFGIICYGCSFLLWLSIVKDNELTYIFPIVNGLVTIMTIIGGVMLLHEKINIMQISGIILIIVGVTIVNFFK